MHEHECEGKLMDCLSDYLDGELDADRCTQIEAHMDHCDCCREFVASLKASLDAAHQLEKAAPPEETCRRVMEQVLKACRESKD